MTAGDLAAVQKLYLNLSIFVRPSTAMVKYTINGSDPRTMGQVFTPYSPLRLMSGTTLVHAVAFVDVEWPWWSPKKVMTAVVSAEALGFFTVSVCQDGKRTTEEECDDGNGGGSGCSSQCTIENGWTCPDSAEIVIPNSDYPSIKDVCFDCQAASKAAAEKAIANGLPPPPVISYACPSGFYLGEPCGTCMPCIKGFHCIGSPSNKRLLCEAGTYADREQSLECKLCPPHSISRRGYRGAESILDCLCNGGFTLTVGTAMVERTCQMCVDSYKDTIGPEACMACPPDSSFGPSAGATLIVHSFNSQPEYNNQVAQIKMYDTSTSKWIVILTSEVSGFNKRPPFPLGPENMWLTDSTGARLTPTLKVHCTCNRGYHNAFITDWHVAEAKRVQKEIDAGTPISLRYTVVMPPLTDVLCVRCKAGHYCVGGLEPEKQCALSSWAFHGSIECSPCPDNALHPSSGTPISSSEECVCAPGYYSLNDNMGPLSCAACPRGLYKEVHGSFPKSSCLTCPPGTYAESINATLQAECRTCSAVGDARMLTSSRGSTKYSDCISGVYLAVANTHASRRRPTRVYQWDFLGNGSLDTRYRVAPIMDPVFDSNGRTGPLDGITRVNWISNQDWDPAQPLQGSCSQGLS